MNVQLQYWLIETGYDEYSGLPIALYMVYVAVRSRQLVVYRHYYILQSTGVMLSPHT